MNPSSISLKPQAAASIPLLNLDSTDASRCSLTSAAAENIRGSQLGAFVTGRFRRSMLPGFLALVWPACSLCALGSSPEEIAAQAPVAEINVREGVAVKGYDVVAYFTNRSPVKGSPKYVYQWQGATWQFATTDHRAAFVRDPEKYAPQYGGYCSYAISLGSVVDIDPTQWKIVDGKLYLNNNPVAQGLWARDPEGHIKKGDVNWGLTPRRPL